ncbi:hypothetical protein ACFFP0_25420 [Rhizobium puerariae]|uniref:Helix-turn-helix domain-containing protein n=1 Tax=Rhizobium puerariae TaxID=1585791 RepID=A0ABV6ANS0_9HYPH
MTQTDVANDNVSNIARIPDSLAKDSLWGSKAIERFLGCTPHYVKTLLKDEKAPVYSRAGRIFSIKSELFAYMVLSAEGKI